MIKTSDGFVVGIDNGNAQTKTANFCYISGLKNCGSVLPALQDELIEYNGEYWSLVKQRSPYRRDKTQGLEAFILTLFGVAKELHLAQVPQQQELNVHLAVGLPPEHYGKRRKDFQSYFMEAGEHCRFKYINGASPERCYEYWINVTGVSVFIQGYAASFASQSVLQDYDQYYIIDIGGYTTDVLLVDEGRPDASQCYSLNEGMIPLGGGVMSMVSALFEKTITFRQVEMLLQGKKVFMDSAIVAKIEEYTQQYATNLVNHLCELGVQIDSVPVLFVGGGSLVLRPYFEKTRIAIADFVEDVSANASGYEQIASLSLRRRAVADD